MRRSRLGGRILGWRLVSRVMMERRYVKMACSNPKFLYNLCQLLYDAVAPYARQFMFNVLYSIMSDFQSILLLYLIKLRKNKNSTLRVCYLLSRRLYPYIHGMKGIKNDFEFHSRLQCLNMVVGLSSGSMRIKLRGICQTNINYSHTGPFRTCRCARTTINYLSEMWTTEVRMHVVTDPRYTLNCFRFRRLIILISITPNFPSRGSCMPQSTTKVLGSCHIK